MAVAFQQIEIDDEIQDGRPVLRMFGCTAEGHSVLVHVHHFRPYFFVPVPVGLSRADLPPLTVALNVHLSICIRRLMLTHICTDSNC